MKRKGNTTYQLLGIIALSLLTAWGCGAKTEPAEMPLEKESQSDIEGTAKVKSIDQRKKDNESEQDDTALQETEEGTETPEETAQGAPATNETITVGSMEELIWEIAPDKNIVLAPGYYNMSEYLEKVWEEQGERWNENNPYVKLQECYDGVELIVYRADGLRISGEATGETEIVVDPRYANVLTFEECSDISLENLVMGHTDRGNCVGNVLQLNDCRDITLQSLDLYGCGVYGIGIDRGTRNLQVYDSVIRECEYGPLEFCDVGGDIAFYRCKLIDSGGGTIEVNPYYTIRFYECEFGDYETSGIVFLDHVYTEDCTWGSGYTYPDIMVPDVMYYPNTKQRGNASKSFLQDTFWSCYAMVDQKTGRTDLIGEYGVIDAAMWINLELNADGSGLFEFCNEMNQITWGFDDAVAEVFIQMPDGTRHYLIPYYMSDEYDKELWLSMELDGYTIWLHEG